MFRIDAGQNSRRYCDGMSRRSFVQLGVAGMASAGLGDVLRAKSAAAASGSVAGKDTRAILIWLDGGPGHMDLYDMKPEAPAEYRGMWSPIPTRVPGYDITEMFPRQAQMTHLFSMVRSLHHDTGDHFAGGHRMLTTKDMGVSGGQNNGKFPGLGSIVARECGSRAAGMPAYVGVPYGMSIGLRPGYFGGNFLGGEYDPFDTGGDPNAAKFQVQNLNLASGLSIDRLEDRRSLMRHLDKVSRTSDQTGVFNAMDRFDEDAFEFVTGDRARRAFDISSEDPRIRDQYGRHSWGQSCLLARRLVEAGTTFVTVHFGGWDHHWNLKEGMERYLPMVDSAVSGLFSDLEQRGLLDSTLVMLCGEFSRTPRMNDGSGMGTPGRDHWGNSMFCLMGGAGVKGGVVVGSTDAKGERPHTRPVRPHHIHATAYRVLGIDPHLHIFDHAGRPQRVLDEPEAIDELL